MKNVSYRYKISINDLLIHVASRIITQWKVPGKEKLEIIESQFLSQYIGEYIRTFNRNTDLSLLAVTQAKYSTHQGINWKTVTMSRKKMTVKKI